MEDSSNDNNFATRYYSTQNLTSHSKDNKFKNNSRKKIKRPNIMDDYGYKQQTKYQRVREIANVTGFVVNIHDATNLDIDLILPSEVRKQYDDVISSKYTYQDLDPNASDKPILVPNIGTTYRCRLRGVGINQLSPQTRNQKSNQMYVEVSRLVDRVDGWVVCTLSDIDIYRRLLVDITIHTCNGAINLKDYLLSKMEGEENLIFYPYITNAIKK